MMESGWGQKTGRERAGQTKRRGRTKRIDLHSAGRPAGGAGWRRLWSQSWSRSFEWGGCFAITNHMLLFTCTARPARLNGAARRGERSIPRAIVW